MAKVLEAMGLANGGHQKRKNDSNLLGLHQKEIYNIVLKKILQENHSHSI